MMKKHQFYPSVDNVSPWHKNTIQFDARLPSHMHRIEEKLKQRRKKVLNLISTFTMKTKQLSLLNVMENCASFSREKFIAFLVEHQHQQKSTEEKLLHWRKTAENCELPRTTTHRHVDWASIARKGIITVNRTGTAQWMKIFIFQIFTTPHCCCCHCRCPLFHRMHWSSYATTQQHPSEFTISLKQTSAQLQHIQVIQTFPSPFLLRSPIAVRAFTAERNH